MDPTTSLLLVWAQWGDKLTTKVWLFRNNFAISVFIFFSGFICGNLFGTVLVFFRKVVPWDGFIILGTILVIECINYIHFYLFKAPQISFEDEANFNKQEIAWLPPSWQWEEQTLQEKTVLAKLKRWVRLLNFYKMGLLLGFFIDAFKVGS